MSFIPAEIREMSLLTLSYNNVYSGSGEAELSAEHTVGSSGALGMWCISHKSLFRNIHILAGIEIIEESQTLIWNDLKETIVILCKLVIPPLMNHYFSLTKIK